jgi:hypothetical protein
MTSTMRFDKWENSLGQPYGTVLQVVQAVKTDVFTTTSTSYVDATGLSLAITPKFANSKILVTGNISLGSSTTVQFSVFGRMVRDETPIGIADVDGSRDRGTFSYQMGGFEGPMSQGFSFFDTPATTSTTTYKVQIKAETPQTAYINRGIEGDGNSTITPRVISSITIMEIAQ